jgi:glyoxylase-like metal-dependent hydrolase (beta-lactamase superfamily II)
MKQKLLIAIITLLTMTSSTFAGELKIEVFNSGKNAIFPVTSTIIYGEKDAILVDAQFQKTYVLKLIEEIKATGKKLIMVYISHSDPDYYFGLDEIKKAFPNAKIVSTAQTAYLISASKDDKLSVWKGQLKSDAPNEIIVPEAIATLPDLEGNRIEIITIKNDPAHSFLWIPSLKTTLGGISVDIEGSHIWMADTKNLEAIDAWITQLDKLKSLNPLKVIPSHFIDFNESPQNIDFTKKYLSDYKNAAAQSKSGKELTEAMIKTYPTFVGKDNLEMGAKVFKGEINWDLKSPYPAIGNKVEVNFGEMSFVLDFKDHKHMSFNSPVGTADTVEYTVTEIATNVFMVYWHEPHLGDNVVHIQDYNQGIVYTNISNRNGEFLHLKGTLKIQN